jgi:hypothetical protein
LFQYAKLPNPIQRILSGQPTLSGYTFESVLQFFKLLGEVRIHAADFSIPDVPILQILYPCTMGTLSRWVFQFVSVGISLDKFHIDTLEFFFPTRARAALQQ